MGKKLEWITIVIPLQNTSNYIDIILQKLTYKAYRLKYKYDISTEFVFIDNGSTDNTLDIIQQNFKHPNVVCHREPEPLSYNDAVRSGIEKSSGEFILCMNTNLNSPLTLIDEFIKNIRDVNTVFISTGIFMFHRVIADTVFTKTGVFKSSFENEIKYLSNKYELIIRYIGYSSENNLNSLKETLMYLVNLYHRRTDQLKIKVNDLLGYY